MLAQVEKELGDVEKSAELSKHLVKLTPDNANAQSLLGPILFI